VILFQRGSFHSITLLAHPTERPNEPASRLQPPKIIPIVSRLTVIVTQRDYLALLGAAIMGGTNG
jgi:hypothetical protein